MKSEKAKVAIERFRKEFIWVYGSENVAELCRLFGEITEIAEQEAEERLTRWNNPYVKDIPKGNVLVKYIVVGNPATPYYTVGMRHLSGQWACENELATHNPRFEIIGWREIHE